MNEKGKRLGSEIPEPSQPLFVIAFYLLLTGMVAGRGRAAAKPRSLLRSTLAAPDIDYRRHDPPLRSGRTGKMQFYVQTL